MKLLNKKMLKRNPKKEDISHYLKRVFDDITTKKHLNSFIAIKSSPPWKDVELLLNPKAPSYELDRLYCTLHYSVKIIEEDPSINDEWECV